MKGGAFRPGVSSLIHAIRIMPRSIRIVIILEAIIDIVDFTYHPIISHFLIRLFSRLSACWTLELLFSCFFVFSRGDFLRASLFQYPPPPSVFLRSQAAYNLSHQIFGYPIPEVCIFIILHAEHEPHFFYGWLCVHDLGGNFGY